MCGRGATASAVSRPQPKLSLSADPVLCKFYAKDVALANRHQYGAAEAPLNTNSSAT